jgi:hypothetical protein
VDPDPDPAFYLNANPDLDPGQNFKTQKVEFLHEKAFLEGRNLVYLQILVNFYAPGSGSVFPIRIRSRI